MFFLFYNLLANLILPMCLVFDVKYNYSHIIGYKEIKNEKIIIIIKHRPRFEQSC